MDELQVRAGRMPTVLRTTKAIDTAQSEAARHEGDFVVIGFGDSMLPYYRPGTVMVVHPTSYFMLRQGMAVVYRNRQGTTVAHMLVECSEKGWLARGLNNAEPDDDLVTAKNLIGVVKAAFAASSAPATGFALVMGNGGSSPSLLH
jgi:signal peptidase I